MWKEAPTIEETLALVEHLDRIFTKSKCRYTISTSTPDMEDILNQIEVSPTEDIALIFVRLIAQVFLKQ